MKNSKSNAISNPSEKKVENDYWIITDMHLNLKFLIPLDY